jgi:hypothetical protein
MWPLKQLCEAIVSSTWQSRKLKLSSNFPKLLAYVEVEPGVLFGSPNTRAEDGNHCSKQAQQEGNL